MLTPDKGFEEQHGPSTSDPGRYFPRLSGTACTRYGSLSSADGGEEAGHDVSFRLLSRRNNRRQLNYGNYWIDCDDADVGALPIFVIHDATVARINKRLRKRRQAAPPRINMLMSFLEFLNVSELD